MDLLFNAMKQILSAFSLLYRRENLALSLVLLIGCYSAILIPAYIPWDQGATVSNDHQHPKDLVQIHSLAITLEDFFSLTKFLFIFAPLLRSY